jgi:hydrogenase maturation protease
MQPVSGRRERETARTLVLGLGNSILRDDGVGLRVARALRPVLRDRPDVHVDEDVWGGLRLMERMIGWDRAIVIDAMVTGSEPGSVRCLPPNSTATRRSTSAHDVSLATALAVGRASGASLPLDGDILLIGIESEDVENFGEECTPKVEAAVPVAIQAVLDALTWTRS